MYMQVLVQTFYLQYSGLQLLVLFKYGQLVAYPLTVLATAKDLNMVMMTDVPSALGQYFWEFLSFFYS